MKHKILPLLALLLTTALAPAQHALLTTLWSAAYTNNPADVTNLAAMVNCDRHTGFDLEVVVGMTNASAGTLSLQWDTGNTSSYFTDTTGGAGAWGWFSIPLTNGGPVVTWRTNISVNTVKYWRLNNLTNLSVQHITNITVKAYIKKQNNPS